MINVLAEKIINNTQIKLNINLSYYCGILSGNERLFKHNEELGPNKKIYLTKFDYTQQYVFYEVLNNTSLKNLYFEFKTNNSIEDILWNLIAFITNHTQKNITKFVLSKNDNNIYHLVIPEYKTTMDNINNLVKSFITKFDNYKDIFNLNIYKDGAIFKSINQNDIDENEIFKIILINNFMNNKENDALFSNILIDSIIQNLDNSKDLDYLF